MPRLVTLRLERNLLSPSWVLGEVLAAEEVAGGLKLTAALEGGEGGEGCESLADHVPQAFCKY